MKIKLYFFRTILTLAFLFFLSFAPVTARATGLEPPTRFIHPSASIDGKMYVFGGLNYDGGSTDLRDFWSYNPALDLNSRWARLPDPPVAASPSSDGNQLLYRVAGLVSFQDNAGNKKVAALLSMHSFLPSTQAGMESDWSYDVATQSWVRSQLWFYDITSGVWTKKSSPAIGWRTNTAMVYNPSRGTISVLGGMTQRSDDYKNDTWIYSISSNAWSLFLGGSSSWSPRAGHSSVYYTGRLWVLGGRDRSGFLNDIWASSDSGETWIRWADVNSVLWSRRTFFAAVSYISSGTEYVVIMGGQGQGGVTNDVWYTSNINNPNMQIWAMATPSGDPQHLPWSARYGHSAEVINGSIYVMGGLENFGAKSKNDVWSTPIITNVVAGKSFKKNTNIASLILSANSPAVVTWQALSTPDSPVISSPAVSGTQVNLSWSVSPGADGYYLYRTDSSRGGSLNFATSTANLIRTVNGNNIYLDTELVSGRTYFYKVSAYNLTGESPAQATGVSATITSAPITQINLSAEYRSFGNRIVFEWNTPSGTIIGYRIYFSTERGGSYSLFREASYFNTPTNVLNTGLLPSEAVGGNSYFFKISSIGTGGESDQSSPIGPIVVTVPDTTPSVAPVVFPLGVPTWPIFGSIATGNTKVFLDWNPPRSGRMPTGYNIYKNDDTTPLLTTSVTGERATINLRSSSAIISGLTNGTDYTFKISVIADGVEGDKSAASSVATPLPTARALNIVRWRRP